MASKRARPTITSGTVMLNALVVEPQRGHGTLASLPEPSASGSAPPQPPHAAFRKTLTVAHPLTMTMLTRVRLCHNARPEAAACLSPSYEPPVMCGAATPLARCSGGNAGIRLHSTTRRRLAAGGSQRRILLRPQGRRVGRPGLGLPTESRASAVVSPRQV